MRPMAGRLWSEMPIYFLLNREKICTVRYVQ